MMNQDAYQNLRDNQRQLDADGIQVSVSRQALDELLDAYVKLTAPEEGVTEPFPMVSIAISLKRIADAMTGPTNEWGETMAEAVGGNIRRALQDVSSTVHQAMNGRRG